jgi:MoaA/NifB/PqqE/SkfB family radical SAM enzyme
MNMALMHKNVARFKKLYPANRLIRHLSVCACTYGCPAATNFFLERYECPLPTSPSCNSACVGCISVKHTLSCPEVQPRIRFIPSPQEIAQVALHHIKAVDNPVVSFGQGCEGEPLIVADVLEQAIVLIRKKTKKGVINLNTNASRPDKILRLREAGLDSMRVSVNSVRKKFYDLYYNPKGYGFGDVVSSIEIMKRLGGFVSINYLVMPGFTDQKEEAVALFDFIRKTRIDMIQWRNLNYDPMDYFRKMKMTNAGARRAAPLLIGMRQLIEQTKQRFPKLRHGYFNPREI